MEVFSMRTFERDSDGFLERICPEMKSLLLAVVLVAGCTKPNPDACSDGNCTDPAKPFCDVNGTLGGAPDTCIAVSCTAGQFKECRGDSAVTCNAGGNNYDLVSCPNGCGDTGCKDPPPPPPCTTLDCMKHIIPKYLPTICDSLATSANATLDIAADSGLDTDTGCMTIIAQTGGPDLCVLHYGTITIEAGKTYHPHGTRAVALVSDGDFSVNGIIDVSAQLQPDFFLAPGAGYAGTQSGSTSSTGGGGGAGNHTPGASGGTTTTGAAADAGTQRTSPAGLAQLLPGTYAGNAVDTAGGAATLISCRGTIVIPSSGLIDAAGGAGSADPTGGQATGGGAGGNVVLQGMAITIAGSMFSNGGAGGGGGGALGALPGARGGRSTVKAIGGTGLSGSNGGDGGSVVGGPTAGIGSASNGKGGGGGASTGYLLTYTPSGVTPTIATATAVFSPALEANQSVPTN